MNWITENCNIYWRTRKAVITYLGLRCSNMTAVTFSLVVSSLQQTTSSYVKNGLFSPKWWNVFWPRITRLLETYLTFTSGLIELAQIIFFLFFFPENRIWHFMEIVCIGDNLQGMSKPFFLGKIIMMKKKKKKIRYIVCWKKNTESAKR